MNKLIFTIALIGTVQKAYCMDDFRCRLANSTEVVTINALNTQKALANLKLQHYFHPKLVMTPADEARYEGSFIDDNAQVTIEYKPKVLATIPSSILGTYQDWVSPEHKYTGRIKITDHEGLFSVSVKNEEAEKIGKHFEQLVKHHKRTGNLNYFYFCLKQDNAANYINLMPQELKEEVLKFAASQPDWLKD